VIEASRSYEHRSYAIGRSHLADVLPLGRDYRRVRAALTNPDSRDKPLTALALWVAVFAVVFLALALWSAK